MYFMYITKGVCFVRVQLTSQFAEGKKNLRPYSSASFGEKKKILDPDLDQHCHQINHLQYKSAHYSEKSC